MKSLSKGEKAKLVRSLQDLIDRGRYVEIANFHGGPPKGFCKKKMNKKKSDFGFCCEHGDLLLPWHRLLMVQMEEELGEALPYWDWTEDPELPDLWLGIEAPIRKGIKGKCGEHKRDPDKNNTCNAEPCSAQFVARKPNIELPPDRKKNTKLAFGKHDFKGFNYKIATPHINMHSAIGCEMSVEGTGAYDPFFYLHHSYVDLQWAYWQKLQQIRKEKDQGQKIKELPNKDIFNRPITPFNIKKDGFNTNRKILRNNRARDTLDYKGTFCYEYDKLLFDGKTPEQFLGNFDENLDEMEIYEEDPDEMAQGGDLGGVPNEGKCGKFCPKAKRPDDCEEICTSDKQHKVFVKVFVGVVMPQEAPSGESTFDLCQGEKCVEAGKVGTFGATTDPVDNPSGTRIDAESFYLAQTDVTAVIDKQDWTLEKPLVAKMTKSMVRNLPQPVVIVQELGKGGMKAGGKVMLSPEENRRRYGNLLDEYSEK